MTYIIIQLCGKQLIMQPGKYYDVNRLYDVKEGDKLLLKRILLVKSDSGEGQPQIEVGQPFLEDRVALATVVRHIRGPKVTIFKMKAKKKYRKKLNHRQPLTRIKVDDISKI